MGEPIIMKRTVYLITDFLPSLILESLIEDRSGSEESLLILWSNLNSSRMSNQILFNFELTEVRIKGANTHITSLQKLLNC